MARPKKIKEPDLAEWRQRIRNAEAYLRMEQRLDTWGEIRGYYLNKLPKTGMSVNLIFAIGRALVPQLYFKAPRIAAKPSPAKLSDPAARLKARVVEAIDAQIIRVNKLKSQFKLGVLDAYRFNIFVLKHGYSTLSTEFPNEEVTEEQTLENDPMVQQLMQELGMEMPPEDESEYKPYSYHDLIHPDMPWSLRVPPEDFLIPWGTRNIYEAPWCAFRIRRPLADVQADPVYDTKVTKELRANWLYGDDSRQASLPFRDSPSIGYPTQYKGFQFQDEGWFTFYEIWDKRAGKVFALSLDEGAGFLRNEEHHLPFGLPVSILQFNDDGEDFWSTSDAATVLPLVKEFNETRTIEHLTKKQSLLKVLIDKNKVDSTNRKKLLSGEPGPMIEVDGGVRDAVMFTTPAVSRDYYNIGEETRTDIRELTGYSRNSMAEFEAGRRSATEANIVQQNLMLRGDERRDLMADFITEAFGDKINPMIFKFWTEPRLIEISGYPGAVEFVGSHLRDKYLLEIAADSTIPVGRAVAKQEAESLMQTYRGDPKINQDELYRIHLASFETAPGEALLLPLEQAAGVQMQLMEALGQAGGGGQPQGNPMSQAIQGGPGA